MKSQYVLLLTSCLLGCSLAKPANVLLGYQDSLGQYSFGYSAPGSARSEVRTLNGATRGAYSYVDGSGQVQSAQYIADGEHGFRVLATNLPEAPLPVQETAEVVAARAAHLQALQEAENNHAEQVGKSSSISEEKAEEKEAKEVLVEAEDSKENILAKSLPENIEKDEDKKIEDAPKESEAHEVIGTSSSQTVFNSHIAGLPVIAAPLVVRQIINQPAVPIFRVAQGEHEIEPSSVDETLNAQAESKSITPAGTALKGEEKPATRQAPEDANAQEEKVESFRRIIAPVNVIPLSSSYSNFLRYSPPLRYITYAYL